MTRNELVEKMLEAYQNALPGGISTREHPQRMSAALDVVIEEVREIVEATNGQNTPR